MAVPDHHKKLAQYVRGHFGETSNVVVYRDNDGRRPVPIAECPVGKLRFYSTIGLCDTALNIPAGSFEFAAMGSTAWLANALTSSVYWLKDRRVEEWPLVCEDVVRQNARSPYRHMAYLPSAHVWQCPGGPQVRWLLGVPIKDADISIDANEMQGRTAALYPAWLLSTRPAADPSGSP